MSPVFKTNAASLFIRNPSSRLLKESSLELITVYHTVEIGILEKSSVFWKAKEVKGVHSHFKESKEKYEKVTTLETILTKWNCCFSF